MALLESKSNRARRLPGGSLLSIAQRWPAPLVGQSTYARVLRVTAPEEPDADHDGWQPIRLRHDDEPALGGGRQGAA
jgi:hypothetical protein